MSECTDECDHPPRGYYIGFGLKEYQVDYIIEGFHAPNDYPTHQEWLKMSDEEKLKYQ